MNKGQNAAKLMTGTAMGWKSRAPKSDKNFKCWKLKFPIERQNGWTCTGPKMRKPGRFDLFAVFMKNVKPVSSNEKLIYLLTLQWTWIDGAVAWWVAMTVKFADLIRHTSLMRHFQVRRTTWGNGSVRISAEKHQWSRNSHWSTTFNRIILSERWVLLANGRITAKKKVSCFSSKLCDVAEILCQYVHA